MAIQPVMNSRLISDFRGNEPRFCTNWSIFAVIYSRMLPSLVLKKSKGLSFFDEKRTKGLYIFWNLESKGLSFFDEKRTKGLYK